MPALATDSAAETITGDPYPAWRMHFIVERQDQIAAGLADNNLTDAQRASLQRQKAYDDHVAAIPRDDRDRLFGERSEEIGTNRDGVIDRNEHAGWHDSSAPSTIARITGARRPTTSEVRYRRPSDNFCKDRVERAFRVPAPPG